MFFPVCLQYFAIEHCPFCSAAIKHLPLHKPSATHTFLNYITMTQCLKHDSAGGKPEGGIDWRY
jgi:hypothetical protein